MPGYELIGEEERAAVNEVFDDGGVLFRHGFDSMRNGRYRVVEFEKAFAEKIGVAHAQAVTSGTSALKVGLMALGVGPGDEVITQCHTFVATVEAILDCGATPIVTEVNWTLNMDPVDLESKITDKTKVILPVHMLGGQAPMGEIMQIAKKHGISVLEDTAQALGGSYKGKYLGAIGDVGTFSFDHGKVLTTGEGGMVVMNDEALYLAARHFHDHGHEDNPAFPRGEDSRTRSGFNYRMMELQGALGVVQLKKLDYALQCQRSAKAKITAALREWPVIRLREFPDPEGETGDTLVFFLENPETARFVATELKKQGVGFKNLPDALNWHFAGTWEHIFPNISQYKGKSVAELWEKSDNILRSAIAIPIFVKMDDEKIAGLIDKITGVLRIL